MAVRHARGRLARWVERVSPSSLQRYRRAKRASVRVVRGATTTVANTAPGLRAQEKLDLRKRSFERAYRDAAWTSTGESLSGDGSSLVATEQLRQALPDALVELGVDTLLDVPCGDWNWMSRVDLPVKRYIGGDLLQSVVEANQRRYADERHAFCVIDLCGDPLPQADLLLCRDAWIHFSYVDIRRALANICRAEITYVATTTFPETKRNEDLVTGIRWRHLNLEAAPFDFPPPQRSLPKVSIDQIKSWLCGESISCVRFCGRVIGRALSCRRGACVDRVLGRRRGRVGARAARFRQDASRRLCDAGCSRGRDRVVRCRGPRVGARSGNGTR